MKLFRYSDSILDEFGYYVIAGYNIGKLSLNAYLKKPATLFDILDVVHKWETHEQPPAIDLEKLKTYFLELL